MWIREVMRARREVVRRGGFFDACDEGVESGFVW